MRVGAYLERLDQAVWLARVLQVLSLALAIAVLVLSRQSTIVHVAPPQFQQAYQIGPTYASREYLEQMTTFLVTNALTVNPESAEHQMRSFLGFLTPVARGRLESVLMGDAQYIKKNNLTQAFYPRTLDFYSPTKLRVTGTLMQWLAGKVVTERDAAYTITVEVKDYALRVKDFSYVPDDSADPGRSKPHQQSADGDRVE